MWASTRMAEPIDREGAIALVEALLEQIQRELLKVVEA